MDGDSLNKNFPKLSVLQKELSEFLEPNPVIFWTDLIATSLFSFSFFIFSAQSESLFLKMLFMLLSTFGYYRSIFFNHEISHAAMKIRGFELAYNILIGYWIKFPTYIYAPHRYHHAKNTYGTYKDSEYADVKGKVYPILILPLVLGAIVPVFLFFRFALIPALLPFVGKKGRDFIFRHLSTFSMLPTYERPLPNADEKRRWYIQDFFCFMYWWLFLGSMHAGILDKDALIIWAMIAGLIFFINHLRSMVAHAYESEYNETSFEGQLADTMTIEGKIFPLEIWAPMSISYHTVHHLFPQIPYHHLKKAHERLVSILPKDHPYQKHIYQSFFVALGKVLHKKD